MARRVSKRKQPDRDDFRVKEQWKIEEGVFDRKTMMNIEKVFTHGIVSRMIHIISKGKEADVYLAEAGEKVNEEYVVLKIFNQENTSFKRRTEYVKGDPRFDGVRADVRSIIRIWCRKEYGNLKIAEEAQVSAPKPYYFKGNVLAMQLIGDDGVPSPILKDIEIENPERVLDEIIENMKRLYSANLVHGDISEYNILIKDGMPFLIDIGQGVSLGHPKAGEFLERDVTNILYYFKKTYGVERNQEKVVSQIKS
jgi:Serine/threonine protein kinase involved in cell cycle control